MMNNSSSFSMEMHLNLGSEVLFNNAAWDDHNNNDPFESALSSMVSSPVASNGGFPEGVMLKELIGRLGSICNSGDISPNLRLSTTTRPQLPCHPNTTLARSPDNSREGSSVSEQIPAAPAPARKRKGKTSPPAKVALVEKEESKAKKSKQEGKAKEEDSEAPKDYIHVRARRGQATDSHSLAERVRREKISERMKFLQDLVPGCNKVTGKAVMLDEIITYVQSLQRQVEFLSMKLSTVNPRMEFNPEALLSKEIHQSRGSFPQGMYPLESSTSAFPYGYNPQQLACISTATGMPLPSMDGFGEGTAPPQVSGFWEDDLQSLVQMGFGPNQPHNFHGLMAAGQMKVEQ